MNVRRKNIVVLAGLLLTASLQAMTPEEKISDDRQARLDRLQQLEADGKLAKKKAVQDAQPAVGKVLSKRDLETRGHDDEPDPKNAKHGQKNEVPDVLDSAMSERARIIQQDDVDQSCGIATVPPEVLVQIAGHLDFKNYKYLSRTCRFFSSLLKDSKAIEECLRSELRSRGIVELTAPLCTYFPECMKTSGVEERSLEGHEGNVFSVRELNNGTLASCSGDGTIKIWDPNTGGCLRILAGHDWGLFSVIELNNGTLASCSRDNTIKIWDPNTGECLQKLRNAWGVYSVIELHNGALASCSGDNTIKIWNPNTGKCLHGAYSYG